MLVGWGEAGVCGFCGRRVVVGVEGEYEEGGLGEGKRLAGRFVGEGCAGVGGVDGDEVVVCGER